MNMNSTRSLGKDRGNVGLNLAALLGGSAILLAIVAFYTGLIDFLFGRMGLPVTPGIVGLALAGLAVASSLLAVAHGRHVSIFLVAVPLVYTLILVISQALRVQDVPLVMARILYICCLPLALIAAHQVPDRRLIVRVFTLALLLLCAINFVDYFLGPSLPVPMSEIPGRAGGLHINPNISASLIAISVPPIAVWLAPRWRIALYAISLAAILATLSRGGVLVWLAAIVAVEAFVLRPGQAPKKVFIAAIMGAAVIGILIIFGDQLANALISTVGATLSPELASRLYFDIHDFAADQRRYGAAQAFQLFVEHPFFGSGAGMVGRWQFNEFSHNMILQTLAEFGLIGAVWLAAFMVWLYRIAGRLGGCLVILWLVGAMFSHNLFDSLSMLPVMVLYSISGWRRNP